MTTTETLDDLIATFRAIADDIEAEREGRTSGSALDNALTFDNRALSVRIPEALFCGGCREVRFDASLDADGFCPTCARYRLEEIA